jgi:hypothetical protein
MTGEGSVQRTVDEIRTYLAGELNSTLRQPGMYGGEMSIRLLIDATAFAGSAEDMWRETFEDLATRGAFSPLGVRGAFEHFLPESSSEDAMASVYADIVHQFGWLELDRELPADQYARLAATLASWSIEDRRFSDVIAEFGQPSLIVGGANPLYPKTLTYATSLTSDPLICFHLWNQVDSGHKEPILLAAAQTRSVSFADSFIFTPRGAKRRKSSVQDP